VTNDNQRRNVNFEEVVTRNEAACRLVAGFSAAMPTLAEFWRQLGDALSDVPALSNEVTRMSGELAGARLDRANLLAAVRAALAAHDAGEPDPLSYLRDELHAQGLGNQRRPA
jgi:hypothetical protein